MAGKILSLTSTLMAASVLSSGLTSLAFAPNPYLDEDDEEIVRFTEEDIQEMNDGNAFIMYDDEGYATTIVGYMSEEPIHTMTELRGVIDQLGDLLGLGEEYEIEPIVQNEYRDYISFTFRQYDDGFEVANSTLKILLNTKNYPIVVQSSIVPNIHSSYTGTEITAEEAEEVVNQIGINNGILLTVFEDYTSQCVLDDVQIAATRCYRIYTDNPFSSQGTDMPYLVHYVDFDGNYLKNYPTNNLTEEILTEHDNDAYFENLTATNYTFTINRNGEDFTFTVPVSYNSADHQYYLADPSRKIILADYYDFMYRGTLSFETASAPETWSENHLITYYNYIKSYDYYKRSFNYASTDGFGIPILILTGYCDYEHNPIDNQCSLGTINGWSAFGASDINTYAYSMDVTAHEFTHAVSGFARQGNLYYNEYGAINEGFSDIMGNIAEMVMNETDDLTWALGETSGNTMRSMSDPTLYNQPLAVGDPFYSNTIALPNSGASAVSDNGGVHSNDSLLSHLCYILYEEGMSLEDLGMFFYQAIILHTPRADYDDIYAALVSSAMICGYEDIVPIIDNYWIETGMDSDRLETVRNASNEGYARFNLAITPVEYSLFSILMMENINTGEVYYTAAMEDGTFSLCVPATDGWVIELLVFNDPSFTEVAGVLFYGAHQSGWVEDQEDAGVYNLDSGLVADLDDINVN